MPSHYGLANFDAIRRRQDELNRQLAELPIAIAAPEDEPLQDIFGSISQIAEQFRGPAPDLTALGQAQALENQIRLADLTQRYQVPLEQRLLANPQYRAFLERQANPGFVDRVLTGLAAAYQGEIPKHPVAGFVKGFAGALGAVRSGRQEAVRQLATGAAISDEIAKNETMLENIRRGFESIDPLQRVQAEYDLKNMMTRPQALSAATSLFSALETQKDREEMRKFRMAQEQRYIDAEQRRQDEEIRRKKEAEGKLSDRDKERLRAIRDQEAALVEEAGSLRFQATRPGEPGQKAQARLNQIAIELDDLRRQRETILGGDFRDRGAAAIVPDVSDEDVKQALQVKRIPDTPANRERVRQVLQQSRGG